MFSTKNPTSVIKNESLQLVFERTRIILYEIKKLMTMHKIFKRHEDLKWNIKFV